VHRDCLSSASSNANRPVYASGFLGTRSASAWEKFRLRSFRFAAYEPEEFRFGGSAGMAVAHDLFDRDTRRVLQYEVLAARRSVRLSRDLFSLAMSNDLLARCVEDGAEVWDIWRRLQTALDNGTTVELSSDEIAHYSGAAELASDFYANCTNQERLLLESAQEDNQQIASRLRAAQHINGLLVKPRSWLAAACIFHWNRFGLTQPFLRRMAAAMAHCWNPDPCRIDAYERK
jgi:thiopeptide-type bacteriocin biosynthesis protein